MTKFKLWIRQKKLIESWPEESSKGHEKYLKFRNENEYLEEISVAV